ncbi:ABC transporter substrate-binding protein [Staphylococcus chromogenes]|nr:ABC transporter substrate-binding protein [Staphylococcus chromogenes]
MQTIHPVSFNNPVDTRPANRRKRAAVMLNRRRFATLAGIIATLASTVSLTACVTNSEVGNPEGWQEIKPAAAPEVQAMVPAEIKQRGYLTMGTNPPFAPMEFKDDSGQIIGADIDLARAVAAVMGLELRVQEQDFNLILPSISGNTVDFGATGMTDNEERQKSFDFVDYLSAGVQWAAQPGSGIDPNNACGLTVAVQKGTVSETDDVAPKSEACVAAGKQPISVLSYELADQAVTAVVLGRADAFSADSPVTAWAVTRADGKLEPVGEMFDAADYGWPIKKGSDLAPAMAAALQHMIDTGDYEKILQPWGIKDGLMPQAKLNGQVAG